MTALQCSRPASNSSRFLSNRKKSIRCSPITLSKCGLRPESNIQIRTVVYLGNSFLLLFSSKNCGMHMCICTYAYNSKVPFISPCWLLPTKRPFTHLQMHGEFTLLCQLWAFSSAYLPVFYWRKGLLWRLNKALPLAEASSKSP